MCWRPSGDLGRVWISMNHDLGGLRYSFVFYHSLDLQKVIEGGPWTFEQNLLLHHKLEANEDAHSIQLNKMEIWVQVYDIPVGMMSEKLLENIGNYVGTFVKADPQNIHGGWKVFYRIRVIMDVDKPIKTRMKLKREGALCSWINFKYERLSTFCFVCGLLGHSDRDCGIVYANSDKNIERSYGTWLRAPARGGGRLIISEHDGYVMVETEGRIGVQILVGLRYHLGRIRRRIWRRDSWR